MRAEATQSTQDVGHMAAEHAAHGVQFVDHDVVEPVQESGPAIVAGKEPGMEHVGIGEQHIGVAADPRALLG